MAFNFSTHLLLFEKSRTLWIITGSDLVTVNQVETWSCCRRISKFYSSSSHIHSFIIHPPPQPQEIEKPRSLSYSRAQGTIMITSRTKMLIKRCDVFLLGPGFQTRNSLKYISGDLFKY